MTRELIQRGLVIDPALRLVSCGHALDACGLADQVRVGIIGGMTDIITAMWQADSVVSL